MLSISSNVIVNDLKNIQGSAVKPDQKWKNTPTRRKKQMMQPCKSCVS